MSERLRNITTVALLVLMAATILFLVATAPSDSDRVEAIGQRIKCPVCQGESIADSPSQMARDMMDLVAERVAAGADDDAIVDELLGSYSGAVLLDPPASGATLVLWLAPVAAVAVGGAVIYWWRRQPAAEQTDDTGPKRTQARRLIPLLALAGAFAVIVVVAGFFLQDRDGPTSGVADLAGQDLDDVSNETMEAVVAANLDHPQISGMRLALADRYRDEGNYRAAFPHYLAVAEVETSTAGQRVAALSGLAWMTWDGNGEAETALGLLDRALEIQPGSVPVRFLEARILRCSGTMDGSEQVLSDLLDEPGLTEEWRSAVTDELTAVGAGEACA